MALLMLGCSPVGEEQAKASAAGFIENHVKFFSKSEDKEQIHPDYNVKYLSSDYSDRMWNIRMNVSATQGNVTKSKVIDIKIDSKGNVREFNGKPVVLK